MPKSLNEWLQQATSRLQPSSPSAHLDALLLLEHVTKTDRSHLLAHDGQLLTAAQGRQLDHLLHRRVSGEPIAYLVGHKEFFGLDLAVTPDVMIPRPETEALVEHAITIIPRHAAVVDVGTGSGAIAISLAVARPDLHITAADISASTLAVAQRNATKHQVPVQFVQSDLWTHLPGPYDAILANLPYGTCAAWQAKPGLAFEPKLALYSTDDHDALAIYRRFWADIPQKLNAGGLVIIEHEPDQLVELDRLAKQCGLVPTSLSQFVTLFQTGQ